MYRQTWHVISSIGLLVLLVVATTPAAAGTFTPSNVTDQTPTAPIANPGNTRYISGFGNDLSFTIFYEERGESGPAHTVAPAAPTTAYRIYAMSTTTGPTGLASATPIGLEVDELASPSGFAPLYETHFLVKDWPVTTGGTTYAYRAWGGIGNNQYHNFYVSNDRVQWWWVAQFTVTNNFTTPPPAGSVYYNAHDYLEVGGEYYGFGESNGGQMMIMHSLADGDGNHGTTVWETIGAIGGRGDAFFGGLPLVVDATSTPWTPTGSFVDLGHDRGYGKTFTSGNDDGIFLAVNDAATESLRTSNPAAFVAAFTDPANWTWSDDTQGYASAPPILGTDPGIAHDFREHWYTPNPDPDAPWTIIYTGEYGVGRALGHLGVDPPLVPVLAASPLSLSYTAQEGGPVTAPQTVTIENVATGGGPLDLDPITGFPAWLNCTAPVLTTLGPGASTTIDCTADPAALAAGTYTGSFDITSSTPFVVGSPQTVQVEFVIMPGEGEPGVEVFDPAISKTGALPPGGLGLPGEQITWTITVTGGGTVGASDVVVTDTFPAGLRIDSVTVSKGTFSVDGQTVTFFIGQLDPGEVVVLQVVTTVLEGAPATITNTATLTGSGVTRSATASVGAITTLPGTGYPPGDE